MATTDTGHVHPYTHVEPIGPTPLTEEYARIARRWYAEGRAVGPNSDALLGESSVPWDVMSDGEREYAHREGFRIEREYK